MLNKAFALVFCNNEFLFKPLKKKNRKKKEFMRLLGLLRLFANR